MRTGLARLANPLWITIFVVLFLPIAIEAQKVSSESVFDKVLPRLRQRTRVPLKLPQYLAAEDETNPLHANIITATAKRYELVLGFTPDCDGENVCRHGMVSGWTITPGSKRLRGKPVKLVRGITGYFIDAECERICSDSTLTWQQGGHRYTVGIKAADLETLKKVANSAIDNGEAIP